MGGSFSAPVAVGLLLSEEKEALTQSGYRRLIPSALCGEEKASLVPAPPLQGALWAPGSCGQGPAPPGVRWDLPSGNVLMLLCPVL